MENEKHQLFVYAFILVLCDNQNKTKLRERVVGL